MHKRRLMKKGLRSFVGATALTLLAAQPTAAGFNGFQLGLLAGGARGSAEHGLANNTAGNVVIGTTTFAANSTTSIKKNRIGFFGGIFAGYHQEIGTSKVVLGGELYFIPLPLSHSTPSDVVRMQTVSLKKKNTMGGLLSMGMLVSPKLMVRGTLGYEIATFKMDFTNTPPVAAPGALSAPVSFSKKSSAIVPGAGVMYLMTDRIVVGVDYAFVGYKDVVPFNVPVGGTPAAQAGWKSTESLQEHRITARIALKF